MTERYAAAVAVDYWHRLGRTIPCTPLYTIISNKQMRVYNAQDNVDALMRADLETCTILSTRLAESYRTDRELDWIFGQAIAHEYGHLSGLDDSTDWDIMDARSGVTPYYLWHRRAFLRRIER
jgi:hypothetical protein